MQCSYCAASCLQRARSSGRGAVVSNSRAAHEALITCNMSCATWYESKMGNILQASLPALWSLRNTFRLSEKKTSGLNMSVCLRCCCSGCGGGFCFASVVVVVYDDDDNMLWWQSW